MRFKTAAEMYITICKGTDLYCPKLETFVSVYNSDHSFVEYHVSIKEAKRLYSNPNVSSWIEEFHYMNGWIHDSALHKLQRPNMKGENFEDDAIAFCWRYWKEDWYKLASVK